MYDENGVLILSFWELLYLAFILFLGNCLLLSKYILRKVGIYE